MSTINSIINFLIGFLVFVFTAVIFAILLKSWEFRHKIKIRGARISSISTQAITGTEYERLMKHREDARKKWEKILKIAEVGTEQNLHLAIIKADGLFDEILKEHGCPGEDMNQRLKSLHPDEVKNLQDIWEAHKIRNQLAHESDFHISKNEAQRIMKIYHNAIENILSKEIELSA